MIGEVYYFVVGGYSVVQKVSVGFHLAETNHRMAHFSGIALTKCYDLYHVVCPFIAI